MRANVISWSHPTRTYTTLLSSQLSAQWCVEMSECAALLTADLGLGAERDVRPRRRRRAGAELDYAPAPDPGTECKCGRRGRTFRCHLVRQMGAESGRRRNRRDCRSRPLHQTLVRTALQTCAAVLPGLTSCINSLAGLRTRRAPRSRRSGLGKRSASSASTLTSQNRAPRSSSRARSTRSSLDGALTASRKGARSLHLVSEGLETRK